MNAVWEKVSFAGSRNTITENTNLICCYAFLISLQDKIKPTDGSLQFNEAENTLQALSNRNPLSKALLLMHMAGQAVTSRSHVGTERQAQLLQVYYVT